MVPAERCTWDVVRVIPASILLRPGVKASTRVNSALTPGKVDIYSSP
jgi:hypothetical protein